MAEYIKREKAKWLLHIEYAYAGEIGKSVFLTREEAEKALKEGN